MLLPFVVSGCLPLFDASTDDVTDGDTEAPGDTSPGAADTGASVPTWWGVGGSLVMNDEGVPDLALSALVVETQGEACLLQVGLASVRAVDVQDLLAAWEIVIALPPEPACTWTGPLVFTLGFGPTSPDLRPAADRAGWDLRRALGLHLRADGGLFLAGLAATEAMRAGGEPVPEALPLAGTWTLRTLAGLPLEVP